MVRGRGFPRIRLEDQAAVVPEVTRAVEHVKVAGLPDFDYRSNTRIINQHGRLRVGVKTHKTIDIFGVLELQLTVYQAKIATTLAVDLCRPPFSEFS